MRRLRKKAVTLHRAHGHPNNPALIMNLEAHGIPHKHLKRNILAESCDACRAAIGKRDNKTSAVTVTKRQNIAELIKIAKAQRKLSAQRKSDEIPVTTSGSDNSDELEISPITEVIIPSSIITESLANIHRFTALTDEFDYSTLQPSIPATWLNLTLLPNWVPKAFATNHISPKQLLSATSSNTLGHMFRSLMTITRTLYILRP